MIDLILLAILGAVTWFVASEGAWTAGVTFLCTLLAGLVAMNFFEPLASYLASVLPAYDSKMDMVALLGLFGGGIFLFRLAGERMAPTYVQVPAMVDQVGRWLFGAATGYVAMAFILTALHTAPVPREFLGFKAERANLLGVVAPDRQWLGFTQYVTEHAFGRYDLGYLVGAPPGTPHAFDAPYFQVSEGGTTYSNFHWPSFPIRYAMRREQFGLGTAAPSGTPAPVVPVAPAPRPAGGGAVGF